MLVLFVLSLNMGSGDLDFGALGWATRLYQLSHPLLLSVCSFSHVTFMVYLCVCVWVGLWSWALYYVSLPAQACRVGGKYFTHWAISLVNISTPHFLL